MQRCRGSGLRCSGFTARVGFGSGIARTRWCFQVLWHSGFSAASYRVLIGGLGFRVSRILLTPKLVMLLWERVAGYWGKILLEDLITKALIRPSSPKART